MTERWKTLSLQNLIPEPIKAASDAVTTVISTFDAVLNVLVSVLDVISTLIIDKIDLTTIAIKTAVIALEGALETLRQPASVHVLGIPLQRASNADIARIINESTQDLGDPNRPLYRSSDFVAGVAIVYGENLLNIASLIQSMLTFEKIFGQFTTGLEGNFYLSPRNLKAKVITTPRVTVQVDPNKQEFGYVQGVDSQPVSVLLSWDPRPIIGELANLQIPIKIIKQVIFRDIKIISNDSSREELDLLKIAEYSYNAIDLVKATFVDRDIDLTKKYYYSVAYTIQINDTLLDNYIISTPVAVDLPAIVKQGSFPPGTSGIPPDWIAVVNPFTLIPGLSDVINEIEIFLLQLAQGIEGTGSQLKNSIAFLKKFIEVNEAKLKALTQQIQSIINLLAELDLAASIHSFSGSGGTSLMVSDLTTALTDQSDPSRPDFDETSNGIPVSVMGGVVFVAGGGSTADFASASLLFSLLAQGSSSDPVNEALNSISGLVDNARLKVLADIDNWQPDITIDINNLPTASQSAGLISQAGDPENPSFANASFDSIAGTDDDTLIKPC